MPWPHARLAEQPKQRGAFHCTGATAELVSLQHWNDNTGLHCCKVEAFLPGSSRTDMGVGRLTPVIQGIADLPGPFATVDRAGDLVAAGTPVQDAVHDRHEAFLMRVFCFP